MSCTFRTAKESVPPEKSLCPELCVVASSSDQNSIVTSHSFERWDEVRRGESIQGHDAGLENCKGERINARASSLFPFSAIKYCIFCHKPGDSKSHRSSSYPSQRLNATQTKTGKWKWKWRGNQKVSKSTHTNHTNHLTRCWWFTTKGWPLEVAYTCFLRLKPSE